MDGHGVWTLVVRLTQKNFGRACPPNSGIDKEKYTRPYQDGSGFMNSREIKHIFDWFYNFYENSDENVDEFLDVMGWTLEDWIK